MEKQLEERAAENKELKTKLEAGAVGPAALLETATVPGRLLAVDQNAAPDLITGTDANAAANGLVTAEEVRSLCIYYTCPDKGKSFLAWKFPGLPLLQELIIPCRHDPNTT